MLLKIHRTLAVFLGLFVITHLSAHAAALGGPQAHERALDALRWIYRNRFVETLLILAVVTQVGAGARLAVRRWRAPGKGFWDYAQIVSGAYFGVFFLVHAGAALSARHLAGIETNFYWPGGTLTVAPLPYFFAPYYFLAVFAVFTHFAALVHFRFSGRAFGRLAPRLMVGAGAAIGALILLIFSGAFFPFELPQAHKDYYAAYIAFFNRP